MRMILKYGTADYISSNFLKATFHKLYLIHSWVLCLILLWLSLECNIYSDNKMFPQSNIHNSLLSLHRTLVYDIILWWFPSPKAFFSWFLTSKFGNKRSNKKWWYFTIFFIDICWVCALATVVRSHSSQNTTIIFPIIDQSRIPLLLG